MDTRIYCLCYRDLWFLKVNDYVNEESKLNIKKIVLGDINVDTRIHCLCYCDLWFLKLNDYVKEESKLNIKKIVLGDINVITQAKLKIILYIFVYIIYINTEDMTWLCDIIIWDIRRTELLCYWFTIM